MRRPAVRAGLALGVFFLAAGAWAGSATARERPDRREARLLELLNEERRRLDLAPLRWNVTLARLARDHAAAMARTGVVSHASPDDGATYADRLARTRLRARKAAENLARDRDLEAAHRGLMRSTRHRAAILDSELEEVGIGVVVAAGGELFVVQDFAALMAHLDDGEAETVLARALGRAWRQAGARPPSRDRGLSAALGAAVEIMARRDAVDSSLLPRLRGPAWLFAYTTPDPAHLPGDVGARAGDAASFAAAVRFRRSPSAPFGLYWVALVLRSSP